MVNTPLMDKWFQQFVLILSIIQYLDSITTFWLMQISQDCKTIVSVEAFALDSRNWNYIIVKNGSV